MDLSRDETMIRRFLAESFLFEFGDSVGSDSNLFELGYIDSFGLVELVAFLESKVGIELTDEDMVSGALATLAGIRATVRRKRGA
jgi:acyl carrier protein